ncbi:MAG: MATE family efflux transporter, partial [Treponema sp.]|nr:MATE family efflux transporter [Treponema sp.]
KASMVGMIAGTVANIIFDPIFILKSFFGIPGFGRGVAGAAIATVLGNIVSIVIYLIHVCTKSANSSLSIRPRHFAVRHGILRGVLLIGLPASITNILMSLSNILMNTFLVTYGDIPVAGMGIAMKANMLVIFVQMGIGMGVQPLIGYNYGARNYSRMKSVIKFAMLCVITAGISLTALYFVFSRQIISIFINDETVIETGIIMLRALMYSSPVIGILFVFNFSFQAMGKAIPSLALAVSRQGFVFLPCVFVLNHFFHLRGLILSQPIADIVSIAIAFGMFIWLNQGFHREEATEAR